MLKAAIAHKGLAFVDVISPCVTFNNVPTSTKSYSWVRDHMEATQSFDFIPLMQEITTEYPHGTATPIALHDGSVINLFKRDDKEIITSRREAISALEETKENDQILTGILYLDSSVAHNVHFCLPDSEDTHEILGTIETPLNTLGEKELCPGNEVLQTFNESLR